MTDTHLGYSGAILSYQVTDFRNFLTQQTAAAQTSRTTDGATTFQSGNISSDNKQVKLESIEGDWYASNMISLFTFLK